MKFKQNTQSFEILKPFFIPAIYHRIIEGRKKLHQLSISMEGIEKVVKKSPKPFIHASFNQVITGAVLRMEKLFSPEQLNLEVILFKTPSLHNLEISFELVNKTIFKIGKEEYYASIICEYSYNNMDNVTYYPLIYREVCSNGMVCIMAKNFTEHVAADKIFEIGCEWSRCTFENYQKKLNNYFELLKEEKFHSKNEEEIALNIIQRMERLFKIDIPSQEDRMRTEIIPENPSPQDIIHDNLITIGKNEFAAWNAITDFASRENDPETRNKMFLKAGKYLSDEMEKKLNKNKKSQTLNLQWSEILRIAKN